MIEGISSTAASALAAASEAPIPSTSRRRARGVFALGALALALATVPLAASVQVSDGLPFSDIDFSGPRPQLSPNGVYAVYREDSVIDGFSELWSVSTTGVNPTPVRLTTAWSSSHTITAFAISPDSAYVVYICDQDLTGRYELYSVPIGGGVIKKIAYITGTSVPFKKVLSFIISPTSNRVFFVSDRFTSSKYELYSVPIYVDNPTTIRLNADICSDCDVESYRASPDGNTVVYRAGQTAFAFWELFSVPALGPLETAVKISRFIETGGDVDAYFQISPDSTRVVYRADPTNIEAYELYSVPIGGGSSIQLNTSPTVDTVFLISPDSSRAVFRAGSASTQIYSLYSNSITGGTAVRLNTALGAGETTAAGFQISPDSSKVVYKSDEDNDNIDEVWSVAIAGGTPTRLNGALTTNGDVLDFAISPNGARVVYRADQNIDTLNELWSVPIGGGSAVKLNRTLTSGGDVVNYRISPNSSWVVYGADQDVDEAFELLAAPLAGGTVLDVSGPLVSGGDVTLTANPNQTQAYDISANSQKVLYAADEDFNDEVALYVATLAGPPGAPTAVVAVAGIAQATVTFAVPGNDGGSPITGFTVTSNPSGGVDSNANTTALSHLMTNLANGTSYTFTVRATNINGPGDPSVPSNSVTPGSPPDAPDNVVALPRNASADVTFDAPGSDGGSAITGYLVTSNPPGGFDINGGTTGLVHHLSGLTNNTSYTFTVVASNIIGTSPVSGASNPVAPGCTPDLVNVFCDGVESNDTSAWDTVFP